MQTFLTYKDICLTAKSLDYKRLGCQRKEGKQILNAKEGKGWYNHPARKMWVGHFNALKYYINCMIEEWVYRGYKNNMVLYDITYPIIYPSWYNDKIELDKVITSHRSNLLRKDSIFYGNFGWSVSQDIPYYWPVK